MGRFSKNKGKRGERELATELTRVLGVTARRGVQFQGSPDSPDVTTNIPNLHIECKRTERFNLYAAMEQAVADGGETKIPVVCHRQNNQSCCCFLPPALHIRREKGQAESQRSCHGQRFCTIRRNNFY